MAKKTMKMYLVTVTRNGFRRTTTMEEEMARQTVLDAVHLGYEVACRPLAPGEPTIVGVKTEAAS
jgi:hypothetical protein